MIPSSEAKNQIVTTLFVKTRLLILSLYKKQITVEKIKCLLQWKCPCIYSNWLWSFVEHSTYVIVKRKCDLFYSYKLNVTVNVKLFVMSIFHILVMCQFSTPQWVVVVVWVEGGAFWSKFMPLTTNNIQRRWKVSMWGTRANLEVL